MNILNPLFIFDLAADITHTSYWKLFSDKGFRKRHLNVTDTISYGTWFPRKPIKFNIMGDITITKLGLVIFV